MAGNPGVWLAAFGAGSHRRTGDRPERTALPFLGDDLSRNRKYEVFANVHRRPPATAEERAQASAVAPIREAVPQQAVQLPAGPVQRHRRGQNTRVAREVFEPAAGDLVGTQKQLHAKSPVGSHLEPSLHQAADHPTHLPPIVGAPIQSVEENHEVLTPPVKLGIPLSKQSLDPLGIVTDEGGTLQPGTLIP